MEETSGKVIKTLLAEVPLLSKDENNETRVDRNQQKQSLFLKLPSSHSPSNNTTHLPTHIHTYKYTLHVSHHYKYMGMPDFLTNMKTLNHPFTSHINSKHNLIKRSYCIAKLRLKREVNAIYIGLPNVIFQV